MRSFQQNVATLEAADTQVLGASMDNPFANKVFADENGVTFPLLSDIGGKVIREYGIQGIRPIPYQDSRCAPRHLPD